MTNNNKYIKYIREARDDEQRHLNLLSRLYIRLTGYRPMIRPKEPFTGSFAQGVQEAFDDELEAFVFYRDMILNTRIQSIRDIIFIAYTDENKHAQKFNWIITDLKKGGRP